MFELIFKFLFLICGISFAFWFVAAMVKYTLDFVEDIFYSFSKLKEQLNKGDEHLSFSESIKSGLKEVLCRINKH